MDERALVQRALEGEASATRALVDYLLPVVQARVARVLARRGGRAGRSLRQDVEDLVQEVFAALFGAGGRALRAWEPSRGLSLARFCGLLAERETASILRSGRRSPWTEVATELDELERELGPEPNFELRLASREELERLFERLREELSPRGLDLFYRLLVDEEPIEDIARATGMTADALYAWRSRLGKLVRRLGAELRGMSEAEVTRRSSNEERS